LDHGLLVVLAWVSGLVAGNGKVKVVGFVRSSSGQQSVMCDDDRVDTEEIYTEPS
jgi:hypothetical protein